MNQRFALVRPQLFSIVRFGILLVGIGILLSPFPSRGAPPETAQRLFLPLVQQAALPRLALSDGGKVVIHYADGSGQVPIPELFGATSIAWSPDGAYLAAAHPTRDDPAVNPSATLVTYHLDSTEVVTLTTVTDEIWGIVWSPRGDRIAVSTPQGCRILDRLGQEKQAIAAARCEGWAPDGRRLVFSTPDGVTVLDVVTGTQVLVGPRGRYASWSPDGRQIAFTVDTTIVIVDADGAHPQQLTPPSRTAFAPEWSPDGQHLLYIEYVQDAQQELKYERVVLTDRTGIMHRVLTTETTAISGARWSPDGAYIAARPVKFGAIGVRVVRVSDGKQLFEGAYSFSSDLAWHP
jgi:dipeptidyl aminopeptidase/acylaminoacyl peptidase